MTRANESGFTLLEVLVALAITGLAVGAAFQIFGTMFQGQARAERVTTALLIAESKLSEVGTVIPLKLGSETGRTAEGYSWRTEVRDPEGIDAKETEQAPIRAFEVGVTVSWPGAGSDGISLSTLKLRPKDRDE
jgi:general secretion pathway protein I